MLPLLSGCVGAGANSGAKGAGEALKAVGQNIPDMPGRLRETCPGPSVGDAESPWAALARTGGQLIACEKKRAGAVAHADAVKKEFSQ